MAEGLLEDRNAGCVCGVCRRGVVDVADDFIDVRGYEGICYVLDGDKETRRSKKAHQVIR